MNYGLKVIAVLALTLVGCHAKKSPEPSATTGNAEAPTVDPRQVVKCQSGKPVQIIKGDCQGTWRIASKDGKTVCEFAWGPPVYCPRGTKPYGFEALCYGTTVKPFVGASSQATPETCLKTYGKVGFVAHYEMKCCPL